MNITFNPHILRNDTHFEIAVPNRNAFRNIVSGYIQDTVFFVAERELT